MVNEFNWAILGPQTASVTHPIFTRDKTYLIPVEAKMIASVTNSIVLVTLKLRQDVDVSLSELTLVRYFLLFAAVQTN